MGPLTKQELARHQILDSNVRLIARYKNNIFDSEDLFLIPSSSGFNLYTKGKIILQTDRNLAYIMEQFDVFP